MAFISYSPGSYPPVFTLKNSTIPLDRLDDSPIYVSSKYNSSHPSVTVSFNSMLISVFSLYGTASKDTNDNPRSLLSTVNETLCGCAI